jgi:triosephosphate isomerase
MRKPIIGGNWKMNGELGSNQLLAADLRRQLGSFRGADLVVFPPAPFLHAVSRKLQGSAVAVGAQDVRPETNGAFTGGLSIAMARSVGAVWTLVGHSERRTVFGENDSLIADKFRSALTSGLSPVLCIGETGTERSNGRTMAVLTRQLDSALTGLGPSDVGPMVLAYEPVWAIGTGVTASPDQAQQVHLAIRAHVAQRLGMDFASSLRIQYGGSVKPGNARELMTQPDIDGALVGGASLSATSFTSIARAAALVTAGQAPSTYGGGWR